MLNNILFLSFLALNLICFTAEAQTTGQAKLTHDGSDDAMTADYHGLMFDVNKAFTLVDVEVWSAGSSGGQLEIMLKNREGKVLEYRSVSIPGIPGKSKPIPVTVALNWTIYPAENCRIITFNSYKFLFDQIHSTGKRTFPFSIGPVGRVKSGLV